VGTFLIQRTNELLLEHSEIADPLERYFKATFGWLEERPHYGLFMMSLISRASYDKKSRAAVLQVYDSGRKRLRGF